jgi:hypothetical protein
MATNCITEAGLGTAASDRKIYGRGKRKSFNVTSLLDLGSRLYRYFRYTTVLHALLILAVVCYVGMRHRRDFFAAVFLSQWSTGQCMQGRKLYLAIVCLYD